MCGITGILSFSGNGERALKELGRATQTLSGRGPDHQAHFTDNHTGLGHCRLSVIDPSPAGNQPMQDASGRYVIVYNGECYNYRILRQELEAKNHAFRSDSDTEVVLQSFIEYGSDFLQKINGFFALAIYDRQLKKLFLARDRFGIKPLFYYRDADFFCFGSEIKALLAYPIPRNINPASLALYLHLNYVPGPETMLAGVCHIPPGHYAALSGNGEFTLHPFYRLPSANEDQIKQETNPIRELRSSLEQAVQARLVSDVPLGTFLSGGVDSAIVTALAKKKNHDIRSFSIGYTDVPYLDETPQAEATARYLGTQHTTFRLGRKEISESAHDFLRNADEPFADSSAIAVSLLSRFTKDHVTVALSGDGGDELFAGYRKHKAEWLTRRSRIPGFLLSALGSISAVMPASRSNALGDKNRQLQKWLEGSSLSYRERYWRWCGFTREDELAGLLNTPLPSDYYTRRDALTAAIATEGTGINDVLQADVQLVLAYDMLVKTDRMSMAHGLEVRLPFLDQRVVENAFRIPGSFKIKQGKQKWILKECCKDLLPADIFSRPKKGFEIPLHLLIQQDLRKDMDRHFHPDFLRAQGLFNPQTVARLAQKSRSANPGDTPARVWALLVFQHWWARTI